MKLATSASLLYHIAQYGMLRMVWERNEPFYYILDTKTGECKKFIGLPTGCSNIVDVFGVLKYKHTNFVKNLKTKNTFIKSTDSGIRLVYKGILVNLQILNFDRDLVINGVAVYTLTGFVGSKLELKLITLCEDVDNDMFIMVFSCVTNETVQMHFTLVIDNRRKIITLNGNVVPFKSLSSVLLTGGL